MHARSKVAVSTRTENEQLRLMITDDGVGIPQTERDLLMRRHAKADESGTGLGLAIASDIAKAAGGTLMLDDAAPGLTASLVLPLARQCCSTPTGAFGN
jgi:signal transduction histidine kinase